MNVRVAISAVIISVLATLSARGAEPTPPEPEDYRQSHYRAPTPETLSGARVVTTAQAEAIWKRKEATFVDVLPHAPRPQNLPPGTIWRDRPHLNIPGSIWLPDTGYGALAPSTEAYLRAGLAKASGGDHARALVVYCRRNCWMSWNAAKRAVSMGYTNVIWYPEGTDGWSEAGLPVQEATPEPRRGE